MPEERIYSVTKEDIRCSALDCVPSDSDRFFFSFPSCEPTDENDVERCRTWVKNAGNIELLKCKSSELAGKFYLCCHHFPDWTAADSTQRYIAANATPTIFDCTPISDAIMKSFPVTSESPEDYNVSENMECLEPSTEDKSDPTPEPNAESSSSTLNCLDAIKTENDNFEVDDSCSSRHSEGLVGEDNLPLPEKIDSKSAEKEPELPPVKKTKKKKSVVETSSTRPSRKAKQDAADRISKQFVPMKDSEQSGTNGSKESEDVTLTPEETNDISNTNSNNQVSKRSISSTSPFSSERSSAKCRIVSKDVLSKLSAVVSFKPSSEKSNDQEDNRTKITLIQEPGSKSRLENVQIVISPPPPPPPPPQPQANFVKEPLGLRTILPKRKCTKNLNDKPRHASLNLIPIPRTETKSPTAISFDKTLMDISRTTSTQTNLNSSQPDRLVLKILACDSKLCVFTGLPSYDVLDKITDATLRLVMSNKTTMNDMESTMRVWIMLTCTKFMLGIPTKALSVMYEIPEEECQKVIEKTSLFLRKTLSLPDGQKFVWMLPHEVLNGIADCSDSLI